jgi:predicted GH43/DUF377 family glycosyl hydrolase
MIWKKLGKIFDPTEHKLANNCVDFAQSPQVLIFEKHIRIYFSTRSRDSFGKYLSQISYVEFDKSFKNILNVASDTVLPLGNLGCFDEHGIFPLNVLRVNDKVFGYISGISRRVSVTADASIGLAVSTDDGLTFERIGEGPVLTSSLNEPFLVCDPFVLQIDGVFHMWYLFGLRWIKQLEFDLPDRVYKIGHATSADGINWEKEGAAIIEDRIDQNECQALPSVIQHNGKYHMYFCYRNVFGYRTDKSKGYRLGYAFSEDLITWTRDDSLVGIDVSENEWDSEMICYPHVFELDGKVYLLYNGNEFGRYGFGLAVLEENQ